MPPSVRHALSGSAMGRIGVLLAAAGFVVVATRHLRTCRVLSSDSS
jgi:hypothetical protein